MRIFASYILGVGAGAIFAGCGALRQAQGDMPPIGAPRTSAHHATSSSYQVLYRFRSGADGANPLGGLIDVKGTLYGTTLRGGNHRCLFSLGCGTVFSLSTSGAENVLYRFRNRLRGIDPASRLLNVHDALYGTTGGGGDYGKGTVYSIGTGGAEKVLYSFQYTKTNTGDACCPTAGLIDHEGTLYGTTPYGGGIKRANGGTVYSVSKNGAEKVLYRFADPSDGHQPSASLLAVNGTLYGTTAYGGSGCYRHCLGNGTVYSVTTTGYEKMLHSFRGSPDGKWPFASLINVKGTLYGTTSQGGVTNSACPSGCGTIFSISTSGVEKVLYSFAGSPSDGAGPEALIDMNGTLYGTTTGGGASNNGTVFSITSTGLEHVLYSFAGGTDGKHPAGGLTDVDGTLYGTTLAGGSDACSFYKGCGTVFELTP